jgi:hypothetical protein
MKKATTGCGIIFVLLVLAAIVAGIWFISNYIGRRDNLVAYEEKVHHGRSLMASAVNNCTTKMKAVWEMAREEGLLEQETYQDIAKARAGMMEAAEAYEAAENEAGETPKTLQGLAANLGRSMLNVRVAFENYPQLRTAEVYQKAMAAVEEGMNEIKTAMDDWITDCKNYNTYRRQTITSFFVDRFYGDEFPERVDYYEGGIENAEDFKPDVNMIKPDDD